MTNTPSWNRVLGYTEGNTLKTLEKKYRKLALRAHPDHKGGSHDAMTELGAAWAQAQVDGWRPPRSAPRRSPPLPRSPSPSPPSSPRSAPRKNGGGGGAVKKTTGRDQTAQQWARDLDPAVRKERMAKEAWHKSMDDEQKQRRRQAEHREAQSYLGHHDSVVPGWAAHHLDPHAHEAARAGVRKAAQSYLGRHVPGWAAPHLDPRAHAEAQAVERARMHKAEAARHAQEQAHAAAQKQAAQQYLGRPTAEVPGWAHRHLNMNAHVAAQAAARRARRPLSSSSGFAPQTPPRMPAAATQAMHAHRKIKIAAELAHRRAVHPQSRGVSKPVPRRAMAHRGRSGASRMDVG